MIFGRPTNLWLGTFTAVFSAIVLGLAQLDPPIIIPGVLVVAITGAVGAIIALVANQPPTVSSGDQITIQTAKGEADRTVTVH